MTMTRRELIANETLQLISADKVEGTPVYNFDGERLGTVPEADDRQDFPAALPMR